MAPHRPLIDRLYAEMKGRLKEDEESVPQKDGEFINDRVHANIQRDGTFSVVPQIKGGVTTPAQLRKIADDRDRVAVDRDLLRDQRLGGRPVDDRAVLDREGAAHAGRGGDDRRRPPGRPARPRSG